MYHNHAGDAIDYLQGFQLTEAAVRFIKKISISNQNLFLSTICQDFPVAYILPHLLID